MGILLVFILKEAARTPEAFLNTFYRRNYGAGEIQLETDDLETDDLETEISVFYGLLF